MFKYILAQLRWGELTQEQQQELETLTLKQVLQRPYLKPKLQKHY